ncbi:RNA-splicing factor [Arthrobotrys megalospora]
MADDAAAPDTAVDPPVTFFRRKGNRSNHRKRPPTPPPKVDSDSDSDYSSTDETGAKLPTKRRKTKHVVSSSSSLKPTDSTPSTSLNGPTYTADRSTSISKSDDATKRSNWHNENEEEYLIRKSKPQPSQDDEQTATDDGVYRGSSAYKSFIKKNPDSIQNKGKMGPVKAPTNVRQVVTVDFAPDVCKDYKQTGFCGFGDTCKFLHAREDYKQGWQLDRDWEVSSKKKQGGKDAKADDEEDEDKELANIPFKCVICKGDYKVPIVTKCGHYFCEKCALQRYRKTPSCAICGAGTNGIFNTAKNLQKKLDRKKEREDAKKEEDGEGGEEAGASGITIEE